MVASWRDGKSIDSRLTRLIYLEPWRSSGSYPRFVRYLLQHTNGLTWFRTHGVICVHIGATNHALRVDDIACRHWQAERILAVEFIQLISELQVNLFEVIGQYEHEAKLSGYWHTVVGQYVERHIDATMDRAPVLL